MILIGSAMFVPSCFILGYCLDRFKVWKFVTGIACMLITALSLFIYNSNFEEIFVVGQDARI